MPTYPGDVRFRGKTGSGRLTAKTTLLTRSGHSGFGPTRVDSLSPPT